MGGNRGGAHIHREAENLVMEAGPDGDEFRRTRCGARVNGAGDFPLALFERGLQQRDDGEIAGDVFHIPLLGQRLEHALQIRRGLVHVGLFHLDVEQPRGGIHFNVAHFGGLAHHLLVHLGFRWHVDHHIGEQLCLAGETAARGEAPQLVVTLFDF